MHAYRSRLFLTMAAVLALVLCAAAIHVHPAGSDNNCQLRRDMHVPQPANDGPALQAPVATLLAAPPVSAVPRVARGHQGPIGRRAPPALAV